MPDPTAVNSMFGRIARRYDIANVLLSFGIDAYWRRRLITDVTRTAPIQVLDLATGSGDVAFALSRKLTAEAQITGMDFCQPMLDLAIAKQRSGAGPHGENIKFLIGDILDLPFSDARFDAVTISFGLRNLGNRTQGLREMRRVLRPGGSLHILEFSQPQQWLRPLYYFYLRAILPRIAGMVTGDRAAYIYLNDTISEFPDRTTLAQEIAGAGFAQIDSLPLSFGIVALHHARK